MNINNGDIKYSRCGRTKGLLKNNKNNKHYANKNRAKNCTSANQKSLKKTR